MARKAAASRTASRPIDPADRDRQILAALDLRSEFISLGVVFAKDFPRADGWLDCYAVPALRQDGKEESSPSAGCNIRTGRYHDFGGGGENLSFWDFAAAVGRHADWRAAREHYAAKVGVPQVKGSKESGSVGAIGGAAGKGGPRAITLPASVGSNGSPAGHVAQSNGHGHAAATSTKAAIANSSTSARNPLDQLTFLAWTPAYERLARLWCLKHKPGATLEAIHAAGGRVATYRTKTAAYTVLALPVYGPGWLDAEPISWIGYNLTGKPLPVFRGKGKPIEWIKVKSFGPVGGGLIGRHGLERIQAHAAAPAASPITCLWKVEGPSDLLALWSAIPPADRDANPIVCNAGGAAENVQPHVEGLFAGLPTNIIHDADYAGEKGAATKWLPALTGIAGEVRHVRLPYEIQPKHGKDLRDYLREPGNSFETLLAIAAATPPVDDSDVAEVSQPLNGHVALADPAASTSPSPAAPLPLANEADNDPHRLARVYLDRHARTLGYWRQEWWRWEGRRYVRFSNEELAAEVNAACKAEFDRINLAALENPAAANADGKLPEALKVGRGLISNVIGALEGMAIVPGAVDQPSWIRDKPVSSPASAATPSPSSNCIALANGILDLDQLLSGADDNSRILLQHSPAWFSSVALPYAFDPDADCPKWNAFLSRNLEEDAERIDLLQEWAGYLLLADTSQQKFLFLEGEGSNGKSVYYAAIEAMLGQANVSHVPLELFAGEFSLYSTIGKLANIAADCGELDKAAEGVLKSFTSGDRMTFNRKGLPLVDATPTARLMIAANNRPRFSDRSRGLWRRMIVVPFNVTIEDHEKVRGMDKPDWWEAQGELPGILNWAIAGLYRLRQQGRFTRSELGEAALEDYRNEVNPARSFLQMTCRPCEAQVSSSGLYDAYKAWSKENGYHPVNERNFFKEVVRVFPQAERKKLGSDGSRRYVYFGFYAEGVDF